MVLPRLDSRHAVAQILAVGPRRATHRLAESDGESALVAKPRLLRDLGKAQPAVRQESQSGTNPQSHREFPGTKSESLFEASLKKALRSSTGAAKLRDTRGIADVALKNLDGLRNVSQLFWNLT